MIHSARDSSTLHRCDSISTSSETELDYFNTYSKEMLIQAVRNCILESCGNNRTIGGKQANLRPFRILLSLLDKPEVGLAILEDVLIDIFRCMYNECTGCDSLTVRKIGGKFEDTDTSSGDTNVKVSKASKDLKTMRLEVIKTANLLFGSFEPYFMWDYFSRCFDITCQDTHAVRTGEMSKTDMNVVELCNLVDFMLDKVSLVRLAAVC